MNIFVTNENPRLAAMALDDKRVVKMVLESAQMLCTAIVECGGTAPYKPTHKNHPANVWVRQSRANYLWLLEHFVWLCDEYTKRYGKVHKCSEHLEALSKGSKYIPVGNPTPFANCAAHKALGLSYKDVKDTTKAYRTYLCKRWEMDKRKPTWTNVDKPKWAV